VAAIIAIIFILQKSCGIDTSGLTDKMTIDTVYIDMTPDTIIFYDTVSKTIIKPVPYEVYIDTSDSLLGVVDCDSVRSYISEYNSDSGLVSVSSKVRGEILEQTVDYSIRTMFINHTDTVKVSVPAVIPDINSKKPIFSVGAGFTNKITPFAYGTMYYNNKSVIAGYNFVDNQVSVGVGFVLSGR